jgi:Uma2 family endonuclease
LPDAADLYRISVDQYDRMVELGVLDEHEAVELIGGILVRKMPKKPGHVFATDALRACVESILPPGWHVRKEDPIRIPEHDEPEPDLAVVRGSRRTYRTRHPGPEDVGIVIEVAEKSLARDRGDKLQIYARAGVPVYWIVNLSRRAATIEVYTRPTRSRGYRNRIDYRVGQEIPVTLDGREAGRVPASEILA